MGMTSFYAGSLRYGPTGKKRKNHFANASKKKDIKFTPMKKEISSLDRMRIEQAKQYKSVMEEAIKNGTFTGDDGGMRKKENQMYTGTLVKGIATMHKSNAVPVISQQEAEDISKMRRG